VSGRPRAYTAAITPRTRTWLAIASAYWLLNGLAEAARSYVLDSSRPPITWQVALMRAMALSVMWVPLTMATFWFTFRYPLGRGGWARSLLLHTGASLALAALRGVAVYIVSPWAHIYRTLPPMGDVLVHSLAQNFFLYWLMAGVAQALLYAELVRARERRAAELEAGLVRARLHVLKSQLQPHFLFNTLNSIAELVHHDAESGDRMIAHLSELLRRSLESGEAQEVRLQDELATLHPYVQIELVRFGSRLRIEQRIDAEVLAARVPHFLLQPLVENAVRHGIEPRSRPGHILVTAERCGPELRIEVRDDGVGLTGDGNGRRGVGLAVTRERLHTLYGARQSCELRPTPEGGAVAAVRIPFRLEGQTP
jgi:two-component system, LytTR family, sensor kinase